MRSGEPEPGLLRYPSGAPVRRSAVIAMTAPAPRPAAIAVVRTDFALQVSVNVEMFPRARLDGGPRNASDGVAIDLVVHCLESNGVRASNFGTRRSRRCRIAGGTLCFDAQVVALVALACPRGRAALAWESRPRGTSQ